LIPAVAAAIALMASPAMAFTPKEPWPPADGPGVLFAHYGEEHWNDADGLTILPKVVEEVIKYRPALVTMSGDKDNDGETDQLEKWREIMSAYDKAGVPYFAGVGNHDRDNPEGQPPGFPPPGSLSPYQDVFKERPYPMGDAAQYDDPMFSPRERPAEDPEGAASHYFVDYGNVRWIFIDNSCWAITQCDSFQLPTAQDEPGEAQFDFLRRVAQEGTDAGKVVFVVMHMPTEDPGDQSYRDTTARMHVMGKGASPDNGEFEAVAADTGVDGVFVAHIKGQFLYRGQGDVPYYIDGGAGGELYTTGPIGTDHGYWHGFRLVRVDGNRIVTDTVPIFVENGIRIEGPDGVAGGNDVQFEAFGKQPVFNDPAKVEALELRDPDPQPASSSLLPASVWVHVRWFVPLAALFLLLAIATGVTLHRRVRFVALPACLVALTGLSAVAIAQQSEPTSTPKDDLPIPARIWTSGNPNVLEPIASADDDPRRNRATQTDSGAFMAVCPGRTKVQITSGWEAQRKRFTSRSASGKIARRIKVGRRTRVKLAQPAEVEVRVKRRGHTVATLADQCVQRSLRVRWNGRGKHGLVRHGRYRVKVAIKSDRKPIRRSRRIRID
jgi:calcineurin-like phosphoesterase family protein